MWPKVLIKNYQGLVSKIPDSLSFDEAAASVIQGCTAVMLAKVVYQVKRGDFVLVQVHKVFYLLGCSRRNGTNALSTLQLFRSYSNG